MKPNHICKWSGCTLGKNGGRKHYYACEFCDFTESWRSVACCKEHYALYIEEVLASRKSGRKPDVLPDRTDMTKGQILKIKQKTIAESLKSTKKELSEYQAEIEELGIPAVVEIINQSLLV